jgi:hypothetical protein
LPPDGVSLSFPRVFAAVCLSALGLSGCVQQAVLENDVRSAIWKSRTLSTASDLSLAHAALSAQLVELEALYQRDTGDGRLQKLLAHGYALMARGFVELRYLDALAAGDSARAERERALREDADARARFYSAKLEPGSLKLPLEAALSTALQACEKHDRAAYEAELNRILQGHPGAAEERLDSALTHGLASAWLQPGVAARCGFEPAAR